MFALFFLLLYSTRASDWFLGCVISNLIGYMRTRCYRCDFLVEVGGCRRSLAVISDVVFMYGSDTVISVS